MTKLAPVHRHSWLFFTRQIVCHIFTRQNFTLFWITQSQSYPQHNQCIRKENAKRKISSPSNPAHPENANRKKKAPRINKPQLAARTEISAPRGKEEKEESSSAVGEKLGCSRGRATLSACGRPVHPDARCPIPRARPLDDHFRCVYALSGAPRRWEGREKEDSDVISRRDAALLESSTSARWILSCLCSFSKFGFVNLWLRAFFFRHPVRRYGYPRKF